MEYKIIYTLTLGKYWVFLARHEDILGVVVEGVSIVG